MPCSASAGAAETADGAVARMRMVLFSFTIAYYTKNLPRNLPRDWEPISKLSAILEFCRGLSDLANSANKIKDDLTTINSKKILQVPSSTRLTDTNKFSTTHSFTSGVNAAINSYRNAAIFYSPEDIEITQNMLTQFNTSTLSDISIFIIIAEGNILIDERVEHLDAWIIAKGTVNTCSISGIGQQINSINSDTCTNQLTINGPVYAENLVLPRTYGSDQSKANGSGSLIDPAERINFTPSTLLWSYDQASKSNIPTTVYLKELSPRF